MQMLRCGSLAMAPDYSWGFNPLGEEVRFTRSERQVLGRLIVRAGHVVARESLLNALEGVGSEGGDRNVDFIVNRLRRKLGDSARDPKFIRTQYGEGYAWIAAPTRSIETHAAAFAVIGPLRSGAGVPARHANIFATELARVMQLRLVGGRRVVSDPAFSPHRADTEAPAYHVEISFVTRQEGCDGVFALYRGPTLLHLSRLPLTETGDAGERAWRRAARAIAEHLTSQLWRTEAFPAIDGPPADPPAPIRLHLASSAFSTGGNWVENDKRLRALLDETPDDAEAQLLLAVNLHSKYVMSAAIYPEQDFRAQDEAEMEALVTAALPRIQRHPMLSLAAAKLLQFIGCGYRPTALDLAHEAFGQATAIASAYTTYGQIRMFEGEIDLAREWFARAEALQGHDANADAQAYIHVLSVQACQAAGDREGVNAAMSHLDRVKPIAAMNLSVVFRDPCGRDDGPEMDQVLEMIDPARASAILRWMHYVSARPFAEPRHRRNILGGTMALFRQRYGDAVVPEEVATAVPELIRG